MEENQQNKQSAKASRLGKGIASLIRSPGVDVLKEKMGLGLDSPPVLKTEENISVPIISPSLNSSNEINISEIVENDFQPRKIFKEKDLEELASSIKENGIVQPLIVMKLDDGYRLIAGERRLRAAKRAGLKKVPVVIKNTTDRERLVLALIENVQRSDLNCVEEALAYYQLMEEFKITQEEVSKKIGKDRSTIANFLRILKLPRQVIDLLQKEFLTFGHAKILAGIKEEERVLRLANEVIQSDLSVRQLEELSKKTTVSPAMAPASFFQEKLEDLKNQLEAKTGYHFSLKSGPKGAGSISIKFNNEAEFNDIYSFLMRGKV